MRTCSTSPFQFCHKFFFYSTLSESRGGKGDLRNATPSKAKPAVGGLSPTCKMPSFPLSTTFTAQYRFAHGKTFGVFQDYFAFCLYIYDPFFPSSSVGKESACNAGDPGLIPESGRSSGEGTGCPLQSSWASMVAQLVKESACNVGDLGLISGLGRSPGGGNGNPLQHPGLENPMDRGAWRLHPRAHSQT